MRNSNTPRSSSTPRSSTTPILARKLLIPTLAVSALMLIGVVAAFVYNAVITLQSEQTNYLLSMAQVFDENLQGKTDMALALAKQVASNPEVVQAFSEDDRVRLITLTQGAYKNLSALYDISQQQFVLQPATVFLRLQDIPSYGDDLAGSRTTLVMANTIGDDISGLELAEDGLGLRGIAVMRLGRSNGSVDVGISLNQTTLQALKTRYGNQWQLSISRRAMQIAGYRPPQDLGGSTPELALTLTTMEQPLLVPAAAHLSALNGQPTISRVTRDGFTYGVISTPLVDYSEQVIGVVDIIQDRSGAVAVVRSQTRNVVAGGLVGLLLVGLLLFRVVQNTLAPIQQLTQVTQSFAEGNLQRELPAGLKAHLTRSQTSGRYEVLSRLFSRRLDEIDLLAGAFERMAAQLRLLVGNLEERVAERTSELERRTTQLRAVADIARDVTIVTDIQPLLDQAVTLVRQRFDFYHAGVFLLDENGEQAVLRAATGDAGRRMLEAGHHLRVGQTGIVGNTTGIVGNTAATGQPHVSQDVTLDPAYFKNPALPDTRSEMALPLRLGNKIIGALDVQSVQPNAFDEGDIAVLQILADQLAIAINNARLIGQLNRSVRELEQAYASVTRQTWSNFARQRAQAGGYRYLPGKAGDSRAMAEYSSEQSDLKTEIHPVGETADWLNLEPLHLTSLPPLAIEALNQNQTQQSTNEAPSRLSAPKTEIHPVTELHPVTEIQPGSETLLAVPIRLRGQVIGVVNMRFEGSSVPQELTELVEEVGVRLGLVLESSRLLHEAQRLAAREQQINWIATEMRSSVDLEAILQSTVRELGKALGARRTYIQLGQFDTEIDPDTEIQPDTISPDGRDLPDAK